ncbi:STAS domain-containing protein [Nostoc sp. FACHB-87]|uniref:STAS domain-containing protein n=1 Tax=Nostocales TaxID=1161 RepID=UPI001688640C|nr:MULTISPECIES: STAS domain-containing protein [Nostocales]MBD2299230.1 STAS domain-containing protein [Nostoc sp. FACHB-190]MBD2456044.1 STAS domain-containing protein [Nostoc sp. FACHB-87]MBD2476532.1 STAS domain-containing protein [Anabaena sp. FACHB-83]MBD2486533.1 STAS domain-containing protein [Aulosira sp. FACHB-615]
MDSTIKVIQPQGVLNGLTGNKLQHEVSNLLDNGADMLLIDLKEVHFIDSSGLGSLVAAAQMVKTAHAKLFVCSVSDQVNMLFQLTKINRVFQTFADQEDCKRQVLATS